MIWIFYNIVFTLVFVLLLPKFLLHMHRRGGYWHNFWQRIGIYPPELRKSLSQGGRFWIHGVSVGEVLVALRVIDALRKKHLEMSFVLTVTTSTGYKIARERARSQDLVIYFPVDLPIIMRRVLNIVRPSRLALIETEIWPNIIRLAAARDIPVYIINGRMSDSSFQGYSHLKIFTSRVLPCLEQVFVQSELDRQRFEALGASPDSVAVVGTAKYDTGRIDEETDRAGAAIISAAGIPDEATILLGASTWPGEEEILLDIFKDLRATHPNLYLVLAPRHAERRDEVLRTIESKGLSAVTRQRQLSTPNETENEAPVFLLDTTGELSSLYSHVDLVFVGKSLTEHGGQNPLEPAICGKAIVVGPNMENFRIVMSDLLEYDAVARVESAGELRELIGELLDDESRRSELGERAANVVDSKRGAIECTVDMMNRLQVSKDV